MVKVKNQHHYFSHVLLRIQFIGDQRIPLFCLVISVCYPSTRNFQSYISVEALLHRCQLNVQGLLHKQLEFSLYFEWLQEFDRIFVYNNLFEIVTYQRVSFKIVCQKLGLLYKGIWLLQLQLPTLLPSSWFKTPSWWYVGLYKRVAILSCLLLSLLIYWNGYLDQPTTQCRKQTCTQVPQTPSFSTIIQEYTAYSCIMQIVQVRGGLVLFHTNTRHNPNL